MCRVREAGRSALIASRWAHGHGPPSPHPVYLRALTHDSALRSMVSLIEALVALPARLQSSCVRPCCVYTTARAEMFVASSEVVRREERAGRRVLVP